MYCVGKRPYVDLVIISVKRDHKLVLVFVLVLKWTSNELELNKKRLIRVQEQSLTKKD